MAKKSRYNDEFRTGALLLLEASGYPDNQGGIVRTAKHLGIPESTLRGWWNGSRNPVPAEMRAEKRAELHDLLETEIRSALKQMNSVRDSATYRDLGTVAAILIDKRQILTGKPTWIVEISNLLKEGKITLGEVQEELGPDLATELFESIGLPASAGREN